MLINFICWQYEAACFDVWYRTTIDHVMSCNLWLISLLNKAISTVGSATLGR
jgi:hypothetical protein